MRRFEEAERRRASRIEAPQAPRGVRCGEGVSGTAPPQKKFDFWSPNSDFWCIVGAIFTVQWTVLNAGSHCMAVCM